MPAPDLIHDAVKNALIKDGWTITDDPYVIDYKELTLFADLAADHPIAAERANNKIVVEIKSFLQPSPVQEFKGALGQYVLYRGLLKQTAPERKLYLAVGAVIYREFFQLIAIQDVLREHQMSIFTVDVENEEIGQWIS